jgi:hypothetical protein
MKSLLFFFSVIVISGCASTKEARRHAADFSPQQIIEAVNSHTRAISTFQANGSISVESPSIISSGSFDLWLKKPDSVRVDVKGPFGIRIASALFAQDHYIFYNSFKNEVMEGDINKGDMPSFMDIQINPKDIIDTFCGARGFFREEVAPDSFSVGDGSYILQFRHDQGTTRYAVDDKTFFITAIEHIDSAGTVWSEERFDFGRRDDGAVIPQSIRLIHDKLESSVSLMYETVHLNLPISEMGLRVPSDARRVTKK